MENKEKLTIVLATAIFAAVGAILGMTAYYQHWLGQFKLKKAFGRQVHGSVLQILSKAFFYLSFFTKFPECYGAGCCHIEGVNTVGHWDFYGVV